MKTLASFSANAVRNLFIVLATVITLGLTSCAADEPAPGSPYGDGATVTDVTVTYDYTVPEELLRYVEIRPCYNNDSNTDMLPWHAMTTSNASHTYHVSHFPMETIFVAEYVNPNSSSYAVDVDWTISMDITISMKIDGQIMTEHLHEEYPLYGNLGNAIENLCRTPLDRTFAVKVWNNGAWKFRH